MNGTFASPESSPIGGPRLDFTSATMASSRDRNSGAERDIYACIQNRARLLAAVAGFARLRQGQV